MRNRITTITAITALAASALAPVAGAQAAGSQARPDNRPAAASVQLGDSAGFDGFTAWQNGAVHDIKSSSVQVPVSYSKAWPKTALTGIVGVEVYRSGSGWSEFGARTIVSGDGSYNAWVGNAGPHEHPALQPNTTYKYRVYVEYKFQRYYAPEGTFTTTK